MPNNTEFTTSSQPGATAAPNPWDDLKNVQPAPELANNSPTPEPAAEGSPESSVPEDASDIAPEQKSPQKIGLFDQVYPHESFAGTFYKDDPDLLDFSAEYDALYEQIPELEDKVRNETSPIFSVKQGNKQALLSAKRKLAALQEQMQARIADIMETGPEEYQNDMIARKYAELSREEALAREEALREATFNDINQHSAALGDIERTFRSRLILAKEQGQDQLPREEFEAFEDEFSAHWQPILADVSKVNFNMYQQSKAMIPLLPHVPTLETIEAQSGNYYKERSDALLETIQSSDNKDKEKDFNRVRDFAITIRGHLDLKFMYKTGKTVYDAKKYEEVRTDSHNQVILHLNDLNYLAHKYGTRPFTARTDYWISSVEEKKQTGPMSDKMRYDRDVVSSYYQVAFAEEVAENERRLEEELARQKGHS